MAKKAQKTTKKKTALKKSAAGGKTNITKKKAAVNNAPAKKVPARKTARKKKIVRRRKTPLSAAEVKYFKDLLLQKCAELIGDVSSIENDTLKKSRLEAAGDLSSMPIHMADIGTDNFEQEFSLGLMDSERKMLSKIADALKRIQQGVYGICEGTGKPIAKARLEAKPWAQYCIEYATMVERGTVIEGEKAFDEDHIEKDYDIIEIFHEEDDSETDDYDGFSTEGLSEKADYDDLEDQDS